MPHIFIHSCVLRFTSIVICLDVGCAFVLHNTCQLNTCKNLYFFFFIGVSKVHVVVAISRRSITKKRFILMYFLICGFISGGCALNVNGVFKYYDIFGHSHLLLTQFAVLYAVIFQAKCTECI